MYEKAAHFLCYPVRESRSHLNEIGESYWKHMGFALIFAARLLFASLAVLIHALIPGFCRWTGSNEVKNLHLLLMGRKNGVGL
jgi:hypothetical protein